jgi:tRNA(Ile)-lysidine synthase
MGDIGKIRELQKKYPSRAAELEEIVEYWKGESTFVKLLRESPEDIHNYQFPRGEQLDEEGYYRKKINDFFEKYNICLNNKKVCVCFSGGADSVALLSAMNEIKEAKQFSLCAVHVNHHIRGEEADRDEEFCRAFCEKRNIEFYSFDVYAIKEAEKTSQSLETVARKLRYNSFEKLKAEENIDYFLTAHHANDTAETIVFNILRGCSVSGLAGIPHVRDFYLRPLIQCSRDEILEYLCSFNQSFITDSTNYDETYTRNYIRHSLFPSFERVNSNYLSAFIRLSESAMQDEDYFLKQLDKITSETDLSLLHPSVSSRYICREYEKLSMGEGLSFAHVKQILSLLDSKEEKYIDVPFGITAIVRDGKIRFIKKTGNDNVCSEDEERLVLLSEDADIGEEKAEKVFFDKTLITVEKIYVDNGVRFHPISITLNGEKIKGSLFVRKRREGDKIFCRGMTRNINKEFMNLKIPKHLRDSIPIICDDEGIVFVPFVGADDRVYLKEKNDFPIYISVGFDGEKSENLYF